MEKGARESIRPHFLEDIPRTFYLEVVQSIRDPFQIIDRDFRILWSNKKAAFVTGTEPERMMGKTCFRLFRDRDMPCPRCPVKAVLSSGRACKMEKRFLLPDGAKRWGEVRAYPLREPGGDICSVVLMGFDITGKVSELDRQKRRLQDLEQALSRLAGDRGEVIADAFRDMGRSRLTGRETEVLQLMAEGYTNPEISSHLSISPHTVKSHVIHIFNKLGVNDRTRAAVMATRRKII
jgi:PAS domain S-box-containing protein